MSAKPVRPGRRQFLLASMGLAGSLLVGCKHAPADRLGQAKDFPAAREETSLNAWVQIDHEGNVTVAVARAEMGQGVTTSLPMLVAEELDCAWSQVRYELISPQAVHGNVASITEALPFRGDDTGAVARIGRALAEQLAGNGRLITGGSTSVRDAWLPLRLAGAAARYALLHAAAREFDLPAAQLRVAEGVVHAPDGRHKHFGELAEAAVRVPLPNKIPLKEPANYRLLGSSPPRLDIPEKVSGEARFGADIRLPGMHYAAVQMSPVAGGKVKRVDDAATLQIPGVVKVLRGNPVLQAFPGVIVVARDFWTARRGAEALRIEWDEGAHSAYDSEQELNHLIEQVHRAEGGLWHRSGDLAAVERSGAQRLDAVYTVPLLAHAALETATCTALFDTSAKTARLKLWMPTQMPSLTLRAAALTADIPEDRIDVHPTLIGGGFGYKGLIEPVLQAVAAARALPDTPVQVIWTREQDIQRDLYRPPAVARATAWITGEGAAGRWSGWRYRSAGPSVVNQFLARTAPPWLAHRLPDKTTIEGAYDKRYAVDAQEIYHIKTPTTAPLGFWRSVGHSHQAFFVESFVDEVAHALKRDPLELRVSLLQDSPRLLKVLQLAAERAGWRRPADPDSALGVALHESFGSVCAQVVRVQRNEAGQIVIAKVVCAIDCGRPLHPDMIRQQVEGAVIFGMSAALYGRITMKAGRVEQSNFHDYPLLTLARAPQVETHIVASDAAPGGVGEVGTPPIAPALCNALFALTGKRIRDLPIADQLKFA